MKDALKSRLEGRPNWSQELWVVLLGMRTSPRDNIGASKAELVFGAPITVPGDLITAKNYVLASGHLPKRIRQVAASRTPTQTSAHSKVTTHLPKDLMTSDYVFVRVNKVLTLLAAKYTGAYKVIERSDKALNLDYGNGLTDWVSIDRLKPAHVDEAAYGPEAAQAPALPRRGRGRPKGSKNKQK